MVSPVLVLVPVQELLVTAPEEVVWERELVETAPAAVVWELVVVEVTMRDLVATALEVVAMVPAVVVMAVALQSDRSALWKVQRAWRELQRQLPP
jgi:hypothetical protein